MSGWLSRLLPPPPGTARRNVPVVRSSNNLGRNPAPKPIINGLPNASVIYGVGAGIFLMAAMVFFAHGTWFSGLIVLFMAGCFLGYAVYFLKMNKD